MSGPARTAAQPDARADVVRPAGNFTAGSLRVGRADDAAEREADRIAERFSGRARPGSRGARPSAGRRADAATERYLRDPGAGQALPTVVRERAERSLGWSFADVRVHADEAAADSARRLGARAYTHGRDIVFGAGRYAPHSPEGQRLIAHELTHVVQQGATRGVVQRSPSYGVPAPALEGTFEPDDQEGVVPAATAPEIQADDDDDAPPVPETAAPPLAETAEPPAAEADAPVAADSGGEQAQQPAQAPAGPATPTLTTSATSLTRGDQLTATVGFTPNGRETMRVTGWKYESTEHGTVNRARAQAAELQWQGDMAASGTLQARFRVTPEGGPEGPEEELTADITVNDRTGSDWRSTVTENAEGRLARKPSPPKVFSDLGFHGANVTAPVPSATTIGTGPNTGMRYVESITAGTYTSTPQIHPDLLNAASRFMTFHDGGGRLYKVAGTAKTLIPRTEYTNLSVSGGPVTFDVPDWEAFYKRHGIIRVTATANNRTVTLQDAWWGLDDNDRDASVEIRDDAAIRTALRIGNDIDYAWSANHQAGFEGFELMTGAGVLAGTRSHEYQHAEHSHRANFKKMMRALDPQRKIESRVQGIGGRVNFNGLIRTWIGEILEPNHEIVDESASEAAEEFQATGDTMAGVNEDPDTGTLLGSVWNITDDRQMTN